MKTSEIKIKTPRFRTYAEMTVVETIVHKLEISGLITQPEDRECEIIKSKTVTCY